MNERKPSEAQQKFFDKVNEKKARLSELNERAATLSRAECIEVARISLFLMKTDISHRVYKKSKVKWTGFMKSGIKKTKNTKKPRFTQEELTRSRAKAQARAKEKEQMSLFD